MGATYAVGYMSQEERDADVRAYQLVSADSLPKDIVLPWVCGECDYLERHWLFIHNPRPAERTDEVAIRGLLLSPSAYVKTTEIGAEVRQDVSEILGTGNETT